MRIVPTAASFPASGPPASFAVDAGGARFYAVQVASDASLLNGALAARRTPSTFWDSWVGDDAWRSAGSRTWPREVAGRHLEAPTGRTTYTLPGPVWRRFARAPRLYYRLLVTREAGRRPGTASVADVDWARAPSVSLASSPAQPVRNPAARFRGSGVLSRPDLLAHVRSQISATGIVSGRDGDFAYVFLDTARFRLTVVECHQRGLTDTVAAMPRRPAAVINGQFLSGIVGIDTEGQVVREGTLVHANTQPTRAYVAQTPDASGAAYRIGTGNPTTADPTARVAFGGLGPVLFAGAPPASLTAWARSLYAFPRDIGRGVVAHHRAQRVLLLLVQQNVPWYRSAVNAMTLAEVRDVLRGLGFVDAVCNDGSDSESLFAGGSWLVRPGTVKDEVMDFALGFVDDQRTSRFRLLVVDGTDSGDGEIIAAKTARAATAAYSPRNLADELRGRSDLAPIAGAFTAGVLRAYQVNGASRLALVRGVVTGAGAGSSRADLFYLSSHASRHGVLWFHPRGQPGTEQPFASPWSAPPSWSSVRWLVLAGCSVLSLRYTRGRRLDTGERSSLVRLHREMSGASATVPGLTPATRTAFLAYHPGWAWWSRVFRRMPQLRGVLGYWYRSPGGGRDVEIVDEFAQRIGGGEPMIDAWEAANQRGVFELAALWAAMVRDGCRQDTLAMLEDRLLPTPTGGWRYFDRHQDGVGLDAAYRAANRLDDRTTCGGVRVLHSSRYDDQAIEELQALAPDPATYLVYDDGVGP